MMAAPESAMKARQTMPKADTLTLRCIQCSAVAGEISRSGPEDTLLVCPACLTPLKREDGVWNALPESRDEHYAAFVANYERIRAAEGRGSRNSEFYLALPYRDISGNNQWQWEIRGRTYECLEKEILAPLKKTRGSLDVLDLGAGNCWLSYRLALLGNRPIAIDLLDNAFDGLGAAHHYESRVPRLFPRFRAELDALPFADGQFDVAIFNASFHYSEDYAWTLGEALRCLRRPGYVVIADTPWYSAEKSGEAMVRERRENFVSQFGFASDALDSLEFLTDGRLRELESRFGLRWQRFAPNYGWRWRMRPAIAKLRRRREPSRFRIYMAEVTQ
jgi:SAM-dependent methyltransferase